MVHNVNAAIDLPRPDELGRLWLRASSRSAWQPGALDAHATTRSVVTILLPWTSHTEAERASALMVRRAGVACTLLCLEDDDRAGPLPLLNAAFAATRSPWVVYAAQDAFAGRNWLRFALNAVTEQPQSGLLAFNDGKWFGQLAAFGMVRREWMLPVYGGLLFHSGYRRHYADVELTLIAQQQRALVFHPHALLVEVDHEKDARPVDAADQAGFQRRAAGGFDGKVREASLLSRFA